MSPSVTGLKKEVWNNTWERLFQYMVARKGLAPRGGRGQKSVTSCLREHCSGPMAYPWNTLRGHHARGRGGARRDKRRGRGCCWEASKAHGKLHSLHQGSENCFKVTGAQWQVLYRVPVYSDPLSENFSGYHVRSRFWETQKVRSRSRTSILYWYMS